MKRSVLWIVLVLGFMTSLVMGQAVPVEKGGPQVTPVQRPIRRPMKRRNEPKLQLQELQSQLMTLETEHQELLDGLKAIKVLAQEEKASKTLKAIGEFMEKQESEHQLKARSLQNRIRRIERVVDRLEQRKLEINRVGIHAPGFVLKDLNGQEVRLGQFRGKAIVLEWISPKSAAVLYHYEKKTLAPVRKKARQDGVVWLSLVSDKGDLENDLNHFVSRYGIDWPILDDREGKIVAKAYGVVRAPQVVIIDSEGKIAYTGAIDNDPQLGKLKGDQRIDYVGRALEALLAGKPVEIPKSEVYGDPIQ